MSLLALRYTSSFDFQKQCNFSISFSTTDDLLCTIDFKYSRKKKQPVREHLKSLQGPPNNIIRGGDDTIREVADMYEHARFETKVLNNIINFHLVAKYILKSIGTKAKKKKKKGGGRGEGE